MQFSTVPPVWLTPGAVVALLPATVQLRSVPPEMATPPPVSALLPVNSEWVHVPFDIESPPPPLQLRITQFETSDALLSLMPPEVQEVTVELISWAFGLLLK